MLKKIFFYFIFLFPTIIQSAETENMKIDNNKILNPFKAVYTLRWKGLSVGKTTILLQKMGENHYQIKSHSHPNLSFLPFENYETSQFSITNEGIIPEKYHFETEEKGKITKGTLVFDWENNKLIKHIQGNIQDKKQQNSQKNKSQVNTSKANKAEANKNEIVETLPEKTQDKLTFLLQLQQDLMAGNKTATYTVAEPKRFKTYTVSLKGEEILNTPLGKLKTLKIVHETDNKERVTEIWLAKDRHYLLVKLKQIKEGKVIAEGDIKSFHNLQPHVSGFHKSGTP